MSPTLPSFVFFYRTRPSGYEEVSRRGFDLPPLTTNDAEHFSCAHWHVCSIFREMSIHGPGFRFS